MLWILLACDDERGPREPSAVVEYDGYVYAGPTSQDTFFESGTMEFQVDEGETVAAEQPYADVPSYWRADLPSGAGYTLRLANDDSYPAVWRGQAPVNDGAWFSGALFGADRAQVDEFLAGLDTPVGTNPRSLADGQVAHLWGVPWVAEGWDCGLVRVNGAPPLCYLQDETTGALTRVESGPLTWFVALNLEGGSATVEDGTGAVEVYPFQGGDMVYAFWFSTGDAS